ncbi:MAG: hypothetical protein PSV46_26445 [Reyranella sp.]|nr:hypothetical protein [Reyranella sp.]
MLTMRGIFAIKPGTPSTILRFESLFLASIVAGVMVAILMYGEVIKAWGGHYQAVVVTVVLFGGAWMLMLLTSRRRSNLARWLLVIGSTVAIVPYLAHVVLLLQEQWAAYLSFVQAGLQFAALYCLFMPDSRAWFAGRTEDGPI